MRIPLARFISIVAHPFVLVVLLILLSQRQGDPAGALRTTGSLLALVIVPTGLLMWRFHATGRWNTIDASSKADRPVLYVCLLAGLLALAYYFHRFEQSPPLALGTLSVALMMALAFALNRWIKLSLHLAFACYCGLVLTKTHVGLGVSLLLLVPLLAWSRLALARHTRSEVIGGTLLGLTFASGLLWLLP